MKNKTIDKITFNQKDKQKSQLSSFADFLGTLICANSISFLFFAVSIKKAAAEAIKITISIVFIFKVLTDYLCTFYRPPESQASERLH